MKTGTPLLRKTPLKRSPMKRTPRPRITPAEREHLGRVKAAGCVACWIERDWRREIVEAHHLTECGRRIGHLASVGLCRWHHQGHGERRRGLSLAAGSRPFRDRYGDDSALLAVQAKVLEFSGRTA